MAPSASTTFRRSRDGVPSVTTTSAPRIRRISVSSRRIVTGIIVVFAAEPARRFDCHQSIVRTHFCEEPVRFPFVNLQSPLGARCSFHARNDVVAYLICKERGGCSGYHTQSVKNGADAADTGMIGRNDSAAKIHRDHSIDRSEVGSAVNAADRFNTRAV